MKTVSAYVNSPAVWLTFYSLSCFFVPDIHERINIDRLIMS